MDRWRNKIAVVTGASSGIGVAIVKALVEEGLQVVGLARRIELVETLANELSGKCGKLHAIKCDLLNQEELLTTFKCIKETFGPIHILINNAACLYAETTLEGNLETLKKTIDTNLYGTIMCVKAAVAQMREADIAGHIINLNSIVGHHVTSLDPPHLNIYSATKFGITALTETLAQELRYYKTKIKVSSISPGLVSSTELFTAAKYKELGPETVDALSHLMPEDVAQAIIYILSTPPHVQIHELTLKALGEYF